MSQFWRNIQREFFSYSRSDRNAIIILAGLILIVILITIFLPLFFKPKPTDFSEMKAVIEEWEKSQSLNSRNTEQILFRFDPNTIDSMALDSLNLPYFVKQNLLSYRRAGGSFNSPEDLRRLYGMNDSIFSSVNDYINLPQITNQEEQKQASEVRTKTSTETISSTNIVDRIEHEPKAKINKPLSNEIVELELNSADTTDLKALPGIGSVFANRIVKYRSLLGGYYKKEQLLEVYNFPIETYERNLDCLTIDTTQLVKIRINFADYSELIRHPYLNKEQVTKLLEIRNREGAFKNLKFLEEVEGFDPEKLNKVRPYLTTE